MGGATPVELALELIAQGVVPEDRVLQSACMPGKDCIIAFPPCWHNSLVQLDLKNVDDIPGLLAGASRMTWPNLKKMSLRGEVDDQVKAEDEIPAAAKQTCTALVQGLITMLPSTPAITTIQIDMREVLWSRYSVPFQLKMCLGNPAHGVEAGCESCSYQFVPNCNNGVAVAAGTDFSSHLATELQHTVRRHQLKDLGVFFHYNEKTTWGNGAMGQWVLLLAMAFGNKGMDCSLCGRGGRLHVPDGPVHRLDSVSELIWDPEK